MSMSADINQAFDELLRSKDPKRVEILKCQFAVYEGLEWDSYAGDIVQKMLDEGLSDYVDSNMRCYLDS